MKIELKKVKFFNSLSEETNAFSADVFVNDKKVGYARNDGRGGSTEVRPYNEKAAPAFKEAEEYCLLLPPLEVKGLSFTIPMNLETFVDALFEKWLLERDVQRTIKRLDKDAKTNIVIINEKSFSDFKEGLLSKFTYNMYSIHHNSRITNDKSGLRKDIEAIKSKLPPGEIIYNDLSSLD